MAFKRMRLARLGVVHGVGLAALAFATAAHATDDLPPPAPPAAASTITAAEPDALELGLASADDAELSASDPENPGNTAPPAPATAQLDRVRQGWVQVISPPHAPKSPERASVREPQRWTLVTRSYGRQYHPRHVQYHRLSKARSEPRAPVLAIASFSSGEPARIKRSSSSIWSPNRSRNDSENCGVSPHENWFPHLAEDELEAVECAPDPPSEEVAEPSDETTSDDLPESAGCAVAQGQYQPDETQYQDPAPITCDVSADTVVPISEPEAPVASTPVSSDTPAPTDGVSPTTAPVDASVVPSTEPGQPGADVVPAPRSSLPTTSKVAASGPSARPGRSRLGSSRTQAQTERVIPARARLVSTSLPARPRPVPAPSTKPKTSAPRSKVEVLAPERVMPASSHGTLFGDWLLLVLPLSFLFVLGLLVPAATIAGRSLRARAGSHGLSGRRRGTRRSGIRYRD
ncbi:MAG: hypothetical protein V7645_733 [Actinomycetota bacterium]